jgi:hypothetical protein
VDLPPLWTCPRCGHQFVTRNLSHSCGRYAIDDHFRGKDPNLRATFDRLVEIAGACGPLTVYAQKTRLVFMVRVRFANVVVRKNALDLGLWLIRKAGHPLAKKIEIFGPQSFMPHIILAGSQDIDRELEALVCEAYQTGTQEHLAQRARYSQ